MNFLEYSIDQILEENQIPHTWSKSVKNEVTGLELEKNIDRKDLSGADFVTIDGTVSYTHLTLPTNREV